MPVRLVAVVLVLASAVSVAAQPAVSDAPAGSRSDKAAGSAGKDPDKELFTGRVVLVEEALAERGVRVSPEMKGQAVLETPEGELIPLVADWRGRAFFQDERLRGRKVDLVGYRRPGLPYLQVLMVFTVDDQGTRQYTDYWCDICSIPMYEIKECECCQGPIRLRFQRQELPEYVRRKGETADE